MVQDVAVGGNAPRMQFSCYYFHSNRCAWNYTFVRDGSSFLIDVAKVFELGDEGYEVYQFMMDESTLRAHDILYSAYRLSCDLTKDMDKLTHVEGKGWVIYARWNWKGMYISPDFYASQYFTDYPTKLEQSPHIKLGFEAFSLDPQIQPIFSFQKAEEMFNIV